MLLLMAPNGDLRDHCDAKQLGAYVATLCCASACLSRDLSAVCPGGLGRHIGSFAWPASGRENAHSCAIPGVGLMCTVVADGAHTLCVTMCCCT